MGAEQSSNTNRDRLERDNVEYILEQQRRMYEQRCRDLLRNVTNQNNVQQAATTTRSPSQPNQPRPAVPTVRPQPPPARVNNTVQQPHTTLGNQNRSVTQHNQPRPAMPTAPLPPQPQARRLNNTVHQPNNLSSDNQNRSASQLNQPSPVTATAPPRPQPPPTRAYNPVHQSTNPSSNNQNRLDRSPAPYSYRQEDLQNATAASPRSNLYPSLNNNAPTVSTGGPSTSNASFKFSSNSPNNTKPTTASDFVFVNRNGSERAQPTAPRERSVSRARNGNSENDDLKCPTCKNIYTLYIFNCGSGHSSCKSCKDRGTPCKVCGQRITDVRNHALESYVAERKVPCSHKEDGCSLSFKLAEMESHLKECPFKEMPCPLNAVFGHCPWRGMVKQIAPHFDNMHSAQRQAEEGQEMFLPNICTENKFVHLIVKGAFNFLFHVSVSQTDRMVYMATQLIGTKFSAQKWTYEIQIYNKREPRKKYQYVDACTSSNEPVKDIFKEARCATLPLSYAMNFVNEGAISYKFTLEKSFNGRNNFHNKNNRGRGGRHYS